MSKSIEVFPKKLDEKAFLKRPGNILIIHERHIENRDKEWPDWDNLQQLVLSREVLPIGSIQVQEVAIINDEGIHTVADLKEVEVTEQVTFTIANQSPHMLKANDYYIWSKAVIVPIKIFDAAERLEEVFVKTTAEQELMQLFKRISRNVIFRLDETDIEENRRIVKVWLNGHVFYLQEERLVYKEHEVSIEQPLHEVFKWLQEQLGELV